MDTQLNAITKEAYKQNLLSVYLKADNDHIRRGMNWYREAYLECQKEAVELDIPLYLFVAVVASLSPQKRWENNISDAVRFLKSNCTAPIFATGVMKQKVRDILELHKWTYGRLGKGRQGKFDLYNPEKVRKILKGRKIVSFFNNIMYPHIAMTVTVDRWAMRSVGMTASLTDKRYKEIEEVHQEVAQEIGILPHNLQAIVWGVVRGLE